MTDRRTVSFCSFLEFGIVNAENAIKPVCTNTVECASAGVFVVPEEDRSFVKRVLHGARVSI